MFEKINQFENKIAEFFGSPYAVATDCCTHAIELCLIYTQVRAATCPTNTYISIPFTLEKLKIKWQFENKEWCDFYYLGNTNIIDAAVLWRENSYINDTFMCVSFQFKKHLSLGRGGIILTDNKKAYESLSKMRYDGRDLSKPWTKQNIDTFGYHYYMTPETAEKGLKNFWAATMTSPKKWSYKDYPDLTTMEIFK